MGQASKAATSDAGSDTTGQWGSLISWPTVAMHGELLSDGNVLTYGDTSRSRCHICNPTTNAFTSVPDTVANPSCGGTNILPDGRVITVGGGGIDNSTRAIPTSPGTRSPTRRGRNSASNAYPTWYASTTVLPNGNLLRMGGVDGCQLCNPEIPEGNSPATNRWTTLSKNPTLLPFYPNIYVRPDGTVALTGASQREEPLMIYNPNINGGDLDHQRSHRGGRRLVGNVRHGQGDQGGQ